MWDPIIDKQSQKPSEEITESLSLLVTVRNYPGVNNTWADWTSRVFSDDEQTYVRWDPSTGYT